MKCCSSTRAADLVVLIGVEKGQALDYRRTVNIGDALSAAGRPVLLPSVCQISQEARTIVVAWKDTKELRRTIVDAMPLLTSSEDVVVLAMEESHGVDEKALADTVRFLTRHSVRAKSIVKPRQTGVIWMAVIDIAHRLKADLIVAGAYGHSRFGEWIFGGVTRTLLQNNLINGFCLRLEVGSVSPPREFQSLRSIKDVA